MAYKQTNNPFPVTSCGRRRTFTQGGAPGDDRHKESRFKNGPTKKTCNCWKGHSRVPGTKPCAPGSCKKDKSGPPLTDASYNKSNVIMREKHKKETGKTLGNQLTSGVDPRRVSFAARFGGANDPIKDSKGEMTKHGHALKRWGFSSNAEAKAFANKNKKS
jgi:hypothetical protein